MTFYLYMLVLELFMSHASLQLKFIFRVGFRVSLGFLLGMV